jgi:hypothetical protein
MVWLDFDAGSVLAGKAGSLGVIEERRWLHIIFLRRGVNLFCNKIRKTRDENDLLLLRILVTLQS